MQDFSAHTSARALRVVAMLFLAGAAYACYRAQHPSAPVANIGLAPTQVSAQADSVPLGPGYRGKPIERIQLGDRVLGRNPIREQAEEIEPDPATWRHVALHLRNEDGPEVWVDLIRPDTWIAENEIYVGNVVFLDLIEMGIEGDAEVTFLGPCPRIQPGNGGVVIGLFKRKVEEKTPVVRLRIAGQPEPTIVTATHQYWSADRHEFVPASQLGCGQRIDTELGMRNIESINTVADYTGHVFNFESSEHVYRVGSLGTLVHNSCAIARRFEGPSHHIASDKNSAYTPLFEDSFNRGGLSLQSPWNRMRVPGHVGPHGQFYEKLVFDRLSSAVGTQSGSAARQALISELKAIRWDIRYGGWDALLKAPASQVDVLGRF